MIRMIIFILFSVQMIFPLTIEDVLGKFIENTKGLKSIQAVMEIEMERGDQYNFMKLKYFSKGKKTYMKAPPPASFTLVSDAKRAFFYLNRTNQVYFYDPGDKTIQYSDPVREQNEIHKGMKDLKKVGDKYYGWKKVEVFEAKPVDNKKFVSRFLLWVDVKNGFLYKFETFDLHNKLISRLELKKYRKFKDVWVSLKTVSWQKSDNLVIKSTSEIKNAKVNEFIDDSVFDFKIPKGAKVKDMTKKMLDARKKK